jgi:hypothetical protein
MPRRAPKRVRPSLNPSLRLPETPASWLDTEWMNPIKRICIRKVCKKEFVVTAPHQHACPECQPLHHQERRHEYYVEVELPDIDRVYELHNAARAKRCPPKMKVCVICGNQFLASRSAITCSPDCSRQRRLAYRQEYDEKNLDAVNRKRREKLQANRDEINAARREKGRANRDKINAARRTKRRERRAKAPPPQH